jgi:hypothetical protein
LFYEILVPNFAKTCLILYILELRHSLPMFMAANAEDSSYPISPDILAELLGVNMDSTIVTQFLTEQSRFSARQWEKGEHLKFGRQEVLPLRSIRPLGHGAQGSVDSVELATTGIRYARKRWRSTNSRANQQFVKEIRLLHRLDPQRHIVEIIGTYIRAPTEVGIVMMLADCDLGQALSWPAEDRRRVIADEDLRKGYGCLSYALAHMHSLGIRHKDVKVSEQTTKVTDGVLNMYLDQSALIMNVRLNVWGSLDIHMNSKLGSTQLENQQYIERE